MEGRSQNNNNNKKRKTFAFDVSYKDPASIVRDNIKPDPEKSSGLLGKIGKDMIAKIGTFLLYDHIWLNFMCTCPLAFRACTAVGLEPRPRWNISYDEMNGRSINWCFDKTKGHYSFTTNSVNIQITDPECIQIDNFNYNPKFVDEPVTLIIKPEYGLQIYNLCNHKLSLRKHDMSGLPFPFPGNIYTSIYSVVDEHGWFLCGTHNIYDEDIILDTIFERNTSQVDFRQAVYIQSTELLHAIEEELKFFIYHLGIIINS